MTKGECKMDDMEKMLGEEIKTEFEVLKNTKPGDETHKATVDSLTKLMDRAIELKKFDATAAEENATRKIETDLKLKQMQEEKRDRFIKNVMAGAKDVATIGVVIWGTVASMNFEKEGTLTTSAGRKHLNKLLSWFK